MDQEKAVPLGEWAKSLGREPLDLWREAMANLRQLHSDVWNGVRFFTTVNGILLAGLVAGVVGLLKVPGNGQALTFALVLIVAILGLSITFVARRILCGHRDYYLNMLLRKSLIEQDLGFYERHVGNADLSFPWSVPKEHLQKLRDQPNGWIEEQRTRKGTISRLLFGVYDATIGIWAVIFLYGAVGFGYSLCASGC